MSLYYIKEMKFFCNITGGNTIMSSITSANISATALTAGNLVVPGTLTVVNITSTNLVDTNITATSALITGSLNASGSANILGNIFISGGNVSINTTNPTGFIVGGTSFAYPISQIIQNSSGNIELCVAQGPGSFANYTQSGDAIIRFSKNLFLLNGSGTPAMNIDTSNNIYMTNPIYSAGYVCRTGRNGTFSGNVFNIYWNSPGAALWIDTTNIGTISISSDYRVKTNIQTQTNIALDRISQLRPVTYTYRNNEELSWKADGVSREGFIAHELAEIIPSAVEGEKDEPNRVQSLKLDALCSVMVKAIQELKTENDQLKSRLQLIESILGLN